MNKNLFYHSTNQNRVLRLKRRFFIFLMTRKNICLSQWCERSRIPGKIPYRQILY